MRVLALETAGEGCSCALWDDGALLTRDEHAPRRHAERLLSMVEALLATAEVPLAGLDAIAFGRGPGSFTGLRIACSVAQGLAFGADLPVVGVSSLRAVAERARIELGHRAVVAAFDARMGEVYLGCFLTADATVSMQAVRPEVVTRPDALEPLRESEWVGVGSAFAAHHDAMVRVLGPRLVSTVPALEPRAAEVAGLGASALAAGAGEPAARAAPAYLRDRVARTRAERERDRFEKGDVT